MVQKLDIVRHYDGLWSLYCCFAGILLFGLIISVVPVFAQETDKVGLPVVNQPISVEAAVNLALVNNPMITAKRAGVAAAAASVGMAKAMTRLQASANGYGTLSNMQMILPGSPGVEPQNFTLTADKARINGSIMAMYPLYTGGRLQSQVKSSQALEQAAVSDSATTELDVSFGVRTAYYNVLLQRKIAEAQEQRVVESRERVRIAQEAFEAGRIARYDLLRNQTELAEAEQELNNARRDEATALVDLKSMMGISQTSSLTLTTDLDVQPVEKTLDDLQAEAVARRPEVAAARARITSAEAALEVAKSAYKPQVYATAMAETAVMKDEGAEAGGLIGVMAAIPIIDGGQRKSSLREAQAMLDQMKADERQAVLNVGRDVASAYSQLTAALSNTSLSQAAVSQAEEDYRVIRLRYEAGRATNVEVLDALASLVRARTNYAGALFSYNIARDTLHRATGER